MMSLRSHSLAYILVSGACVAAHNLVLIVADAVGLALAASLILSFAIVVVMGYVGHSRLTYHQPLRWPAFGRYALAMSANLPTAYVTLWLAMRVAGLAMALAAPLSTLASVALNYLLSAWAIRRAAPSERES